MRKLFITSIFCCLICFSSCNNNPKAISKESPKTQKFIRDIPKYKNGVLLNFYFKEDIHKANLKNIENGFDSICIRLWYMYAFGPWQIVEIKKNSKEWTGEFILLTEALNKNDSSWAIQKSNSFKMPRSGWDEFMNELFSKGVTTLPTDFLITGYQFNTDGDVFAVEVATKNYYRIYNYGSLKFNLNLREARTMADIILLIEKEFGVERLHKEF